LSIFARLITKYTIKDKKTMAINKKVLLMILDGWGVGKQDKGNVIFSAKTSNMDALTAKYPNSQLLASGLSVGLPDGVMGNSEVGHLNIGAGRVLYQDLVKINLACEDGSIATNPQIVKAFTYAKEKGKAVHFIGLVSDGGVHSMDTHLYKLCDVTKQFGLDKVYIHAITDGRDTDPKSGLGFITNLVNHLKTSNGKIASVIGRYYAMDRDKRWERVKLAYDLFVKAEGEAKTDAVKAVEDSYAADITDEFIKPVVITENGKPVATIQEGDVIICYNYRTDRLREITTVLSQKDMPEFGMKTMPLEYYTMTRYDDSFKNVNIIYDKDNVQNTLGEVVEKAGGKQIRIAETEKYAHVTFFFSGGREQEFNGEKRLLVSSPKVATYDLQPEMSAPEVKNLLLPELKKKEADFICLNFANGDMVGHTGIYEAITKAVETVDSCVGEVVNTARENGYDVVIIADHGNADNAINSDGTANTAHSLNPVPCILVSDDYQSIENGKLADVAPTILSIMGLDIPNDMTGKVLVKK
jgi:2,3-bisphosphoglycerate-independent phosphoglycerate mutase